MARWDTAFDISLLENPNIIVHCPDKDLAGELMDLLDEHGCRWRGIEEVPSKRDSDWDHYGTETCYWIERSKLSYGSMGYAEQYADSAFRNHIKCTFYGVEPDFEIPDTNFEAIILGTKGGGSDG